MTEVGHATIPITPDMGGFQQDVARHTESALAGVGSRLQSFGRNAFRVGSTISLGLTAPIALGMRTAFNAASDLNEAVNVTGLVFGDARGEIDEFVRSASNIGQSERAAREATATFGGLLQNLGLNREETVDWSQDLTTLASDLGSAFNAEPADAVQAIGAALRGETEPIRRFNVMLSDQQVRWRAVQMGLADTTSEVTQSARAQAALSLIMEQTASVQGDFANTADGAANQQRIMRAEFENAAAVLGQQLLPIGLRLLGWVRDAVEWFSRLSQPMQGIILGALALVAAIGPVVTVVGALATALGVILSPIGLIVLGVAALVAGAIYAYTHFQGFRDVVDAVAQWLTGTAWPMIQQFAQYIADQFALLVEWVRANWASIQEAIGHVLAYIQLVVGIWVGWFTGIWSIFGDDIKRMAGEAWDYVRGYIENTINIIRGIIQFVVALINGDWGKAWDAIKGIASAVWDQIKGVIDLALGLIRGIIGAGLDLISSAWSVAWEGFKTAASSGIDAVIQFFTDLPGDILSAVGDIASRVASIGVNIVTGILVGIGRVASQIWNKIMSYVPTPSDIVNAVGGSGAIRGAANEVGRNAGGTPYWKGGPTWVGERGPELVNLPRGSQVFPNDVSMAMAGGATVHIEHYHQNDLTDIDMLAQRLDFAMSRAF